MSTMPRAAPHTAAAAADPEAQRLRDIAARARQGDAPAIEACAEAVRYWWRNTGFGWEPCIRPHSEHHAALTEAADAWRLRHPAQCAKAIFCFHRDGALMALGEAWVADTLRIVAALAERGAVEATAACADAVWWWWSDAACGAGPYARPGPALAAALRAAADAWRAQQPVNCARVAAVSDARTSGRRAGALAAMGEAWVASALQAAVAQARQGDAPAIEACAAAVKEWWQDIVLGHDPVAQFAPTLRVALAAAAEAWRVQRPEECLRFAFDAHAGALVTMGEAWVAGVLQEAAARARQGDDTAIRTCALVLNEWWQHTALGFGPYAQPGRQLRAALDDAAEAWRAQRPGDCAWSATGDRRAGALAAMGEAWVAGALQDAVAQARQGDAPAIEACTQAVVAWWLDASRSNRRRGPYAQSGPLLHAALHAALAPAATDTARHLWPPLSQVCRTVARDVAAAALREAFGAPRPDVARWEAWCREGGGRIGWALLARATAKRCTPQTMVALVEQWEHDCERLRRQPLAAWIAGDDALARALRRLYGDAAWASALLEQAITTRDADAMDAAQRLAGRAPAASEAS